MFTNFNCNNSLQKQIMLENGDGYCINNINLQDWVNINQTILFKSYTLIFINLFSSGNYVKSINRKNEFKNSNYFIYNSINFFNFKKNLNKYKLIDFFKNSEKISNLNSLNLTKKKINFGKLTWYWVFRTMSQNRFLLNYSEYRNHIVTHKYKNYEIYLKKYEINYNKWLKSMNYVQKNLKTHYLKIEPRRLFKCYVQRIYWNSRDKKKIIKKQKGFIYKNEKFYRRMVFTFKFKVRKLKRKTKLLSGPFIRKFRKKSKEYEVSTKLRTKKSRNISLYSYVNLFDSLSRYQFLFKKRLKQLKISRNNYYGAISSTFIRTNLLSDILKNRKPSLLRNYTFTNNLEMKHSLDFKYMFPKNSIEAETLGYFNNISQKQNVTPVFGSIIKNTRISNMYKKLSIDNSINKNYNKLKNNTTSMLTKKYKFLINNKISEKKTKKIFIKKNNKFSNKLLIKLSTNYSCRKISEKKQNMLNNISERGQTLNKIRSFNRSLNKNSINYIKKNNLLTKLIFNLMFYSKSRVVLKKNIKFANVELVRFRFNLNLIRFNQLITNILLRNVTKTILSNSFFIKKNILISNTKESLSNKINKSTLYDFKLFGDNKKIINKKKKYSILSKRKDLQNAKLTVNGSFINNNLYKNKYKEILKKLEKFGSIWKPKLKKNQKFVYHLPSKVGYIVADKLNNQSIIRYGFANIRGRRNTKPYYWNNKLSIGDLNRKLKIIYKEKYKKINYLNISKSSIFNTYYLYKHFRKYINLVPSFYKIKKQLKSISKKIKNNKNLNKNINFLIKFNKQKIKFFKIRFNIKKKYKINNKKIIKNDINNNILFSNVRYYIKKNKDKKLKKLFFLRLNKKYKNHMSWKYSKITWISKFRQQFNPRLKLIKKNIYKKIRYINYSKIRNNIYDNFKKYKKFSNINFSNLSLIGYVSLKYKKVKKQNKKKFKNRFRWKYFQLRRKIKNNINISIKKQNFFLSNINNIHSNKFLNFFKKSKWSLVNSQNIKNITYTYKKPIKFKDFNTLDFNFINFKYKFKIIFGSRKKGFKKIKFKKLYMSKSSKLKSNTLDTSTTLLKTKLFYLKFIKYNNKININFINNKNINYINMSNLLSTVNTHYNKNFISKYDNINNFYLNNNKKNIYNNLLFLTPNNNKLKTLKSKIFLNSTNNIITQDWYKIRSLELTNFWPKINLITNLDIKNKIKIKCNKESIKLKNYLFNLSFRDMNILDKKRFKLKFFSLNFPNFKDYYSQKPGLIIDNIMRQSKEFSFFITKKENSKISVISKYKYNQYSHLNVNLKKYEYKQLMAQKLRRRLRKRLVNMLKRKLIWFNLKKTSFRKSGWGWKSKYLNRKIKYYSLRKSLKKNFDYIYNDSNSPTIRNEPIKFIGFKLINKLQNKLIYRKFRYNNIRKSFYPTKNYPNTIMYWSKFKDKISKILKPLYKTMKYTNRKRSGFWKMKMYYWKFKSIYLKHPYKQFAQRYYPKIWYKIFRRKFPLKRHRKDWSFRINKAKHMKYFKHEKTYTIYDSSSVYFKYLSSSVKLKKYKNEKRILRKFASQKEDELVGILTKEIEPDFKFRHKLNIKLANWRHYDPLKTGVLNAKIGGTLTMPSMVTKGVGSHKSSDIHNANYKFHYSLLGKNIRNVILKKVRLMSFFFELVSKKFKNKNLINKGFGWNTNYQLETKEFSDINNSLDSKNILNKSENINKYNIFYKNFVFRHELDRSFLIYNFIRSYYSKTEEITDIYNAESVVSNRYLHYTKCKSHRIDRWVINYVYKTKYRKISLFNKLRSTKIKYFKDIDKLILKNSKNFLNKNSTIVSKFYAKYKDIDFLTDRIRSYQFTNRVSKFYQKNLWIFNTFEIQTDSGSWSKIHTKNKNITIFKII